VVEIFPLFGIFHGQVHLLGPGAVFVHGEGLTKVTAKEHQLAAKGFGDLGELAKL